MFFLIIFLLIANVFVQPNNIIASEITPTPGDKVKDVTNILKQIVQDTITPTPISDKPKSYFGNIIQIENEKITLSYKNKNRIINLNDEITYVDLKRNKSKLSNFKVGQEILAMGYLNDDESLNCKRIVAIELKSITNNFQTVTGQIVDISQETSVFVLIPNQDKNNQYQINTDSKTKIINTKNEKVDSSKAIINGKKIIAVIQPDTKLAKTFYASKIILLDPTTNEPATPTPTP